MSAILEGWADASGLTGPDAGGSEEVARIERAILHGDERVLGGVRWSAGRHETQRHAEEAGAPAGRPGTDPPRLHLANGAPFRGGLPMTVLRVMPLLECENDAGGRFTDDPGRDSRRHGSRFLCGCCGYAWFCPVGGDAPDAPTGTGATPLRDALVRA